MSELRTHSLRHNSATGDPNIEMYADGSTSIRNLQNFAKSLVINGAMNVAQRGTSETDVSAGGYYACDRMRYSGSGLAALRLTISQDTESPAGFSFSHKVEVTTAVAQADNVRFTPLEYRFEGQDLQHLEWGTANAKPLSVSFWVRSSVQGDYAFVLIRDEATDRSIGSTFTITANEATNGTWKQITHTFPGDQTTAITNDNVRRLQLQITAGAGSDNTGTDNTTWGNHSDGRRAFGQTAQMHTTVGAEIYIAGLQITPTDHPIEFQHESYGETLLKCQRYYQFIGRGVVQFGNTTTSGFRDFVCPAQTVPFRKAGTSVTTNGVTQVHLTTNSGSSANRRYYNINQFSVGTINGILNVRCDRDPATSDGTPDTASAWRLSGNLWVDVEL